MIIKKIFVPILIIVIFPMIVHFFQIKYDQIYPPKKEILNEMMYFPSGRFLKIVVCDFDIFVSNIVWLRAIQYYGQHALTDYNYPWLTHIFDILTRLDPLFINGYRFGALLIAEDAGSPAEAIKLLRRAITNCPDRWEPLFDAGFINYFLLKDFNKAGRYFKLSALREGFSGRSIRFAAHAFRKAKKYKFAKDLWQIVLKNAQTEKRKETALKSLYYIQIEEDIDSLQRFVHQYRRKFDVLPKGLTELVNARLLTKIPAEPFGGKYILIMDSIVSSTTLLLDELEMNANYLNQRIMAYKAAKGKYPDKLDDLVKEKFIREIPKNPFGNPYIYDRNKGKIILPSYIKKKKL